MYPHLVPIDLAGSDKKAWVHPSVVDVIRQREWKYMRTQDGNEYARRYECRGGKVYVILMHRFLMCAPKGRQVDHINGDGLCNDHTSNLRLCSQSENLRNHGKNRNNKSGFKGVCWSKRKRKWEVHLSVNKQRVLRGFFADKIEAAKAYDAACIKYHGKEFGRPNFPDSAP